jgi:molecular chaperone HtpG
VLTNRLKSHPVCLTTEGQITLEMERVLSAMPGAEGMPVKAERVLEINAQHPVFATLCGLLESDGEKLKLYTELLYAQALLIEGMKLDDPVAFSNGVCSLMI